MAKLIQSVKFKKDYMMLLAFLLFFLIVGSECFLIVWLPWHVRLEGVWARQVAQQEIVEKFDYVRSASRYNSRKLAKPAGMEAALICRSLDRAASYMHKNGKKMDPAQCQNFMDTIVKLQIHLQGLSNGEAYSKAAVFAPDKYLESLRGVKKSGAVKK